MQNLVIDGAELPVIVHMRQGITRLCLRVAIDAVRVSVPPGTTEKAVASLLTRNLQWIEETWRRIQAQIERDSAPLQGGMIFAGRPYRLEIVQALHPGKSRGKVIICGDSIRVSLARQGGDEWRTVLKRWLRDQARALIPARVEVISSRLGYEYKAVTIRDQRTRWGSCSSKRNLSFNWRLVLMPPTVMDYIIIHELCHLRVMGHDERFWTLVAQSMPDYEEPRRWLREHGRMLATIPDGLEQPCRISMSPEALGVSPAGVRT